MSTFKHHLVPSQTFLAYSYDNEMLENRLRNNPYDCKRCYTSFKDEHSSRRKLRNNFTRLMLIFRRRYTSAGILYEIIGGYNLSHLSYLSNYAIYESKMESLFDNTCKRHINELD